MKKHVDQIIEELGQGLNVDDKLFNELEANLKEAVDVAKGKLTPKAAYFVITPATIKAIRRKVNMSPASFARLCHLNLDTLKGWEQGKRNPDAAASYLVPAEAYERIIEKLDDIELSTIVELRRSEKANAIEVSLNDL